VGAGNKAGGVTVLEALENAHGVLRGEFEGTGCPEAQAIPDLALAIAYIKLNHPEMLHMRLNTGQCGGEYRETGLYRVCRLPRDHSGRCGSDT
jgi:hypothetical protein